MWGSALGINAMMPNSWGKKGTWKIPEDTSSVPEVGLQHLCIREGTLSWSRQSVGQGWKPAPFWVVNTSWEHEKEWGVGHNHDSCLTLLFVDASGQHHLREPREWVSCDHDSLPTTWVLLEGRVSSSENFVLRGFFWSEECVLSSVFMSSGDAQRKSCCLSRGLASMWSLMLYVDSTVLELRYNPGCLWEWGKKPLAVGFKTGHPVFSQQRWRRDLCHSMGHSNFEFRSTLLRQTVLWSNYFSLQLY